METEKKYIKASPEVSKRVRAELGISQVGLSKAFQYKMNGELACRARELAISYGAKEWTLQPDPNTEFDYKGNMIQTFDNGAVVFWDKALGQIRVELNQEEIAVFRGCKRLYLDIAQHLATNL